VVARARIPKEHVFAAFLERNEFEVVVDPKRLRALQVTEYHHTKMDDAYHLAKRAKGYRSLARGSKNAEAKKRFLELAHSFDQKAKQARQEAVSVGEEAT
jgi:hypothetical protein